MESSNARLLLPYSLEGCCTRSLGEESEFNCCKIPISLIDRGRFSMCAKAWLRKPSATRRGRTTLL
jgi:hypothetical protein